MTNEEKQLLIKDLCARLPYKAQVMYNGRIEILSTSHIFDINHIKEEYVDIKPYLRPMSSITKKEVEEFAELQKGYLYRSVPTEEFVSRMDESLNSHYLDLRGLIPMGLALEAPKDMYKID